MKWAKRLLEWLQGLRAFEPVSILEVPPAAPSATDGLIILHVDFPVDQQKITEIDNMLAPLRKKYGLDFIVLEPGMTLSRFNDI